MRQPIMIKLLIAYLVFTVTGLCIIVAITKTGSDTYFQKDEEKTLYHIANIISEECASKDTTNLAALSAELGIVDSITPKEATTWIINTNGKIIYSTNKNQSGYINEFDIDDFKGSTEVTGLFDDYFDDVETISSICPITKNYNTYGYTIVTRALSYAKYKSQQIVDITIVTGCILLLLSLLPLFIIIIFVYKPLRKINAAAKEFAKGNFKINQINVNSHDEMAELATSLNTMATQLSEREEFQRKFISNVSHDFRSPLTSIKGYIEAMLDGTITEDLYEKYLKVVLSETNRLTKLAAGLIDLSAVDSDDIVLFQTVFDINTIIFDTVSVFEGQCRKKGVLIDLNFDNEVYEVYADKDKMTQVFSNLVDNAIKFSDDDSTIHVHVYDKGSKVYVSVKDKGVGISPDAITKIFDRFYKSDTSRGRVKNSSGIGLSIVKEIVQAHGENIEVKSDEGKGAEFIFSVPKKGANVK